MNYREFKKKITVTKNDILRALFRGLSRILSGIRELAERENVGTSASARKKIYEKTHKAFVKLSRDADRITKGITDHATTVADKAAKEAGLVVHYSDKRAKEILEIVSRNGESLAAVQTASMEKEVTRALQAATMRALQKAALVGASLKETNDLARKMWTDEVRKMGKEPPVFIDSRGRKWSADAYMEMNVRTAAMRVYNERVVSNSVETGHDLVIVSRGGDPHCSHCFPWEGRILSITGKTKGFPTLEQARAAGLFHPNCTHTTQYFDPIFDEVELRAQEGYPVPPENATPEELFRNKRALDERALTAGGMGKDAASLAVSRDYLERSIRFGGFGAASAKKAVAGLTDADVRKLTEDGGHPPRFEASLKNEPQKWNRGSTGGVVHISARGLSADKLRKVCRLVDKEGS